MNKKFKRIEPEAVVLIEGSFLTKYTIYIFCKERALDKHHSFWQFAHILSEALNNQIPEHSIDHFNIFEIVRNIYMCWPVLYPQITGGAVLPGDVVVKVSYRQSPEI